MKMGGGSRRLFSCKYGVDIFLRSITKDPFSLGGQSILVYVPQPPNDFERVFYQVFQSIEKPSRGTTRGGRRRSWGSQARTGAGGYRTTVIRREVGEG